MEVPDWRGAQTFHPQLTATVAGAPPEVVLPVLATTFRRRRFRLGYEAADGFRATWRSWWDVVGWLELDFFNFTRLRVLAQADPAGTLVTVRVEEDDAFRGRGPCVAALGAGLTALEQQGYAVTLYPWAKQPS